MAYCTVEDLLIGDIPTGGALDPAKYVADAADEMDSKIGFRYVTPVTSTVRPVILLLKRINAHLASGRMILAATISAEGEQLNAYGQSLVADAMLAIEAIASGEMPLPNVQINTDVIEPVDPDAEVIGPVLISNLDHESHVEAFYGRVAPIRGFG